MHQPPDTTTNKILATYQNGTQTSRNLALTRAHVSYQTSSSVWKTRTLGSPQICTTPWGYCCTSNPCCTAPAAVRTPFRARWWTAASRTQTCWRQKGRSPGLLRPGRRCRWGGVRRGECSSCTQSLRERPIGSMKNVQNIEQCTINAGTWSM